MDEILSIFTESNEDMGWMFKTYEPVLGIVNEFLDTCEKCVKELKDEPDKVTIDLSAEISRFKQDVDKKFKPEAIEIGSCGKYISKVKKFQSELESTLSRFSKLKDKISFGGNYMRAIVKKPKVYSDEISEEKYELINNNIRNTNRAMDWVEKVLIDLFNMADQDLNILEIVNKVYNKHHIYENAPQGVVMETDADIVQLLPESRYGTYMANTTDKKTSSRPMYIDRNHDMAKWGEEDDTSKEDDDKEKTLDDYRRPSVTEPEKKEEIPPYEGPTGEEDKKDDREEEAEKKAEAKAQQVQNYYYYTYNNSLNNSDDHSVRTNNSTHTKTDDHSTGKTVNSNYNSKPVEKKQDEFRAVESFLDTSFESVSYTEAAVTSRGKKEYEALCKDLKRKPNAKELAIPDKVIIHFDSGDEESEVTEYITQSFNKVTFANVFTDDGKYVKDGGFEEVPVARYMLNYYLRKDHSFDALFDLPLQPALEDYIKGLAKAAGEECPENIIGMVKKFDVKAKTVFLKPDGNIGFSFCCKLDPEHGIGLNLNPFTLDVKASDDSVAFESAMTEAVGDADDMKPTSDHPIKDALTDIDRATVKGQQKVKKAVQDMQNAGRALKKPIKRTEQWITNMVSNWRDVNETNIKEKMADPHARNNIYSALKKAIEIGALYKAGILLNPLFLFLAVTKKVGDNKKTMRLRDEMIGELKTEMEIVDKKIQDADYKHDDKAKYELMRFKNELNKKLLRVAGGKRWAKVI